MSEASSGMVSFVRDAEPPRAAPRVLYSGFDTRLAKVLPRVALIVSSAAQPKVLLRTFSWSSTRFVLSAALEAPLPTSFKIHHIS